MGLSFQSYQILTSRNVVPSQARQTIDLEEAVPLSAAAEPKTLEYSQEDFL